MNYKITVGRETLVGLQCSCCYMPREMTDKRRTIIGVGLWAHSILTLTLILVI